VLSGYDMVVAGVGEAVWNSLAESPIMARSGDDGPPWAEPMTMAFDPSPMGGEAQTAEAVSDELETHIANGFAEGEATAR
jgi:hypothetical protein